MSTEQVTVTWSNANGCDPTDGRPEIPVRLREAGVLQADFDMVLQALADAEEFKCKVALPITLVVWPVGLCLFCVKDPNAGVAPFNEKYEAQQIKVQRSIGTWGFLFTVPRVDVAVATAAVAAPVVAEIARDAPQPDPVETLKQLTAMLDEGLISQAEFDTKKAEILQRM